MMCREVRHQYTTTNECTRPQLWMPAIVLHFRAGMESMHAWRACVFTHFRGPHEESVRHDGERDDERVEENCAV
jgi:hypothetical protein